MPCPLLAIDVPPHIYHDHSSTDASSLDRSDDPCLPSSSRLSDPLPESLPMTAHAILEDMFLSHRLSGIRASVFHASEHQLRKVCLLHGLDVNTSTNVRDIRLRLLFHVVNGDCFSRRCEASHPSPDRSACACIASAFPSALSITSFIISFLKNSTSSKITTEDLLLIVQSTGHQSPYEKRTNLRRRVLASLDAFLVRCRQRQQRSTVKNTNDPFGDLFMGFETRPRPVLESIMNHHGLLVSQQPRLSSEDMRRTIISHIASGHCTSPCERPRPWISDRVHIQFPLHNFQAEDANRDKAVCDDFVADAALQYEDPVGNEIKILNKILDKSPSRILLLRFLHCKDIPHDPSDNRKRLRITLSKFVRLLEKRRVRYSASSTNNDWPSIVPQNLKDKIAENFRNEISRDRLQSSICASCTSSILVQQRVTHNKSCLDLTCLQHPEMRLSGIPANISSMTNSNLDPQSLAEGLLLDRRGMHDDIVSFCKDCFSHIQKGKTPPLSLANHLLLGDVPPELQNLSVVEESVIARCRAKACIIQLRAGDSDIVLPNTQRGMRGHVVIYPQKPDGLLNVLPPSVEDACTPICVVFIGSQRPTQEWLRHYAKPLIVRRERIRAALLWLKTHNALYRDIMVDEQSLNAFPTNDVLPVHIEVLNKTDAGDILTSHYDTPHTIPIQATTTEQADNDTIFNSLVVTGLDGDATVNEMRAAAIKHMKTKGGSFLQIPHNDKPTNEFYNPDLLPLTYPSLFPYGLGGFENLERSTALSFKRQVKHFFSLADCRFQEHYSFLFTVFNILQRRAILLQTSIKVKRSSFDYFAREFHGISAEAIHRICDRLSQSNDHTAFKCTTAEERRILRLMKEVNVINSHVPGSSAARIVMRNEIRALIMDKGLPSFYITINPADVYNPLVKFLAGADIDIDQLLPEQVPDYMEQSILIAKNPFVAARFFNIYMKAFLKIILGFNPSSDACLEGVLGPISAYYGCVEAQGRGTLHCHMLVWLKDALNCDQIRSRVLAGDSDFQTRMIDFINDCISNEIPPLPPDPITVPSDTTHPCSVRGTKDLHANLAHRKDVHNIVNSCQCHKHSATCYKYWKEGQARECRFGLGQYRYRKQTEFDTQSGELHLRCLDGLVNNFNTTIIELIRCNMDIQFLGSGPSTKAIIYYITDYITKAQLKTHVAYAALALAVQKLEHDTATDDPPTIHAKKLLQKCAFSMIAHQELSGQQVASYLVDLEDHFSSHEFEPMYWTNYEHIVNNVLPVADSVYEKYTDQNPSEGDNEEFMMTDNEENADDNGDDLDTSETQMDDIVISTDITGELEIRTPYIQDYLFRGSDLKSLSIWEYTSSIQKVTKKRARNENSKKKTTLLNDNRIDIINDDDNHSRPKCDFDCKHPDYATHTQQVRHPKHRLIPAPIGPGLPRRDKIECREKYCRLMLILLKPWNTPQDLIKGYDTFEAAFNVFLQENQRWKSLLDNMQLLHECRDNRDDHFQDRSRARYLQQPYEGMGKNPNDADDFESNDPATINTALLTHLMSIDESRSLHINESQDTVNQCLQQAYMHGLFQCEETTVKFPDMLGMLANDMTLVQEHDWAHEYEKRKQTWKTNIICEQEQHFTKHADEGRHDHDNMISHLPNCPTIQDASVNEIQKKPNQIERHNKEESVVNMQSVLSKFTLNEMQTTVYKTIAEHSFAEKPKQLRMFVAGPGGTGKSWVIDALRDFFDSQKQGCRLRLASYTGVASRNIRGMTLHSALCLNKQKKRSSKAKMDLIAMWRNIDYLIIDEVSMIGCRLMLQIHDALCEAKENSELFGGINIIFVGDFAQLPPVGDTKLYSHLEKERVGTTIGQKNVFGKLLWLSIDKVIILKELVRQDVQEDLQFTQLLDRLRTGSCTDADYSFLTRKQLNNMPTNFTDAVWTQSPIIVSNNDVKDHLNIESAKSFAARTKQPLHFYYATDKHKGKIINDSNLRKKLWSYHSGKTEQRIGMLPLCKGMPVMITQNYDVQNGIVNGCIGTLERVNYTIDNEGHRHAHSCVIRTEKTSGQCLPHLKEHQVAVLADVTSLSFTHPYSHVRSSFQRSQLPITPAFALTAHKTQGNTLRSAVLDLESCLSTEAVYVMLSRVKKSDNIRILRPFHKKKITTRISEDLRKEFRRLQYLHTETLNSSPTLLEIDPKLGGMHDLENLENWFNEKLTRR